MKKLTCLPVLAVMMLFSCDLTQEVEIDLPDYNGQPVVECYLEPGKPFRLLLSSSFPFFAPLGLDSSFLQDILLDSAAVSISFNNATIELANTYSVDGSPPKFFNYSSETLVPLESGLTYVLNITLPDGNTITGQTTMIEKVCWDSIVVERDPADSLFFRVLAYMTDDLSTTNYYRRLFSINRQDTVPEQDFLFDDDFNETGVFVFGSGYQLKEGYRAFNTVVHISRPYYDFLESVDLAISGNLNPFQQPSPIKSNVSGSANPIGIFTWLAYDRDTTVVK